MTARRFRRLLWAYPRSYRAEHGAEIVTTLLDMAEAGRGRPGVALHLVLCGLRQRFRLPGGRPLPWIAAVLAAVALGGFGSAAGTWLGWQTAASVPSDRELRALNATLTGMPADAAVYREKSAMQGPNALVRADGTANFSAERVRAALTSSGWNVTLLTTRPGAIVVNLKTEEQVPTENVSYTATKGRLKMEGGGSVIVGGQDRGLLGEASYATAVWPAEAAAVRPMTIGGLLAGAVAGWWLTAAFAYRIRRSGPPGRWAATALSTVGLVAAAVPVYRLYRDAYQVMVYAQGSPYPYIVDGPSDGTLALTCTVVGLLAVVGALVSARPRPAATPATG
ncbi:MAG: hypothetical protein ABW022_24205 [Actinoplanes sp.]